MKKRYYIYGLLVLVILFIAYNFYSANRAEENISELIQTQVNTSKEAISVQYSAIDVSPFRGNIRLEDVTLTQPNSYKRANSLKLDLSYFDFLSFNFGDIEYGLKNLTDVLLIIDEPSYLNRNTLAEVKFNNLDITYAGNMWDAIQSYFTPQYSQYSHQMSITGTGGLYVKPQSTFGSFKSDSVYLQITFFKDSTVENKPKENTIRFNDIIWSPPAAFQNKYAFFIQGFGYEMDSIPFSEAGFSFIMNNEQLQITDGTIVMDLFTLNFRGTVETEPTARFSPLTLSADELSPQFKNVLRNVEQLLGASIPMKDDELRLQLAGPISDPRIITE